MRGQEEAAREKNIHMIGTYTNRCGTDPLYIAYTITGVGFIVEYTITRWWTATGRPNTSRSVSPWGQSRPA